MSQLELRAVSLSRGDRLCVDQLSLSVRPGTVTALLGPNGAGKSSVLNIAAGQWPPSAGRVLLDGVALSTWPARARATKMAVLPQQSALSFPFQVEEVVALGRLPHGTGRDRDQHCVSQALRLFGMEGLRRQLYPALSGGERQRVQLARVLAQLWPDAAGQCEGVLLLDEPTAALDWAHQLELLQHLRGLATQGMAILLVLHDLNLALRFADQVGLLSQGCMQAFGPPQQVLTATTIRQVFGVDVVLQSHPHDGRPVIIQ